VSDTPVWLDKRAVLLLHDESLSINGRRLVAGQVEAIQTILALAAGTLDERQLADWIRSNSLGQDRGDAR
jgi:prophage maintenance system killer protein